MMRIRKSLNVITAAVTMVALLGMASCGESDPTGPNGKTTMKATLQLNWEAEPQFGGYFAAKQDGLFKAQGLDVKIKLGGPGAPTWTRVAQGKDDFAIASAAQLMEARASGADLVGIFAVYQSPPRAIMVHEDTGVTSLKELFDSGKIKTMLVEPKLAYVSFMKKNFNMEGVTLAPYSGNLAKFYNDKSVANQCFMSSEPVKAAKRGVKVKVFSVGESGYNPYDGIIICTRKTLEEEPEKVKAFIAAVRGGWEAYLQNASKYNVKIAENNVNMDAATMDMAAKLEKPLIQTTETEAHHVGYMTQERWQTFAEQLVELGTLEETGDVSKVFVNVMLDQ